MDLPMLTGKTMRSTRRATPLPLLLIYLAACAWLAAGSAKAANLPSPTLTVGHVISGNHGHKQFFSLGCETAAAKDWDDYFNHDFNEFEFQVRLPLSDKPDLGFVGEVNSPWGQIPPYGKGVYIGPIADLLAVYGIPAKAYKNYTLASSKPGSRKISESSCG
jgi:hypothetical protein